MKKTLTSLLCILILAGSCPALASEDVYRAKYVGRDMEGKERWHANTEIRKKEGDVYILTEKGEGVYSSFEGPISWVAEIEFKSTEETVKPLSLNKQVFDKQGKRIRLEEQEFDYVSDIATCAHNDYTKNISRTKEFRFDKDIVNRQLLGLYTQKMLGNGKKSAKVQMVSEEPGFYNIHLRVVKTEDVEINGRKRHAYKLQLDPRLGLLNVAKVFFPRAYVWHSAEPKFEWLRYKGLEGDIRSVKVEVTAED